MHKYTPYVLAVFVYLIAAWGSYAFFSGSLSSSKSTPYSAPVAGALPTPDQSPKTEPCPINGMLYSKEQRSTWEKLRPLGIMVQNNVEARPQSGLSSADVVHEAVAEGGITRFLTIFYCEQPTIVGSVRSARIYFIRLLQGFGESPLYAHVGGANTDGPADALGTIKKLGWYAYNDLDQFAVPFPNYWRDYDRLPGRATEHTVYTNTQKLWAYAAKNRKLSVEDEEGQRWDATFTPWQFQEDAPSTARGKISHIKFGFWDNNLSSDYVVEWVYDPTFNLYKRINGGKAHIDLNTKKQLVSKNVLIAFADESVANDGYDHGQHILYDILGKGDALIFQNGQAIEGTWKKAKAEDLLRFYDTSGKEIEMVRGKIWIEILPSGNKVDYGSAKTPTNTK